ncbi:MAG TPA: hypothetical protein VFE28_04295 [Candidatus Krumholzibacteria bacterium]|nr:hypothetical protein [Candidatus Krumholzibacteria bacterium]
MVWQASRAGRSAALGVALAVLCSGTAAEARSAADLSTTLVVDGVLSGWDPLDAVFRTCSTAVVDSCSAEEEPADDSAWSSRQELLQILVTWDAARLYVAVTGSLGGHALLVFLDHRSGGLEDMSSVESWRRALHFGPELRPDLVLALREGQAVPELWRVAGREALQRLGTEHYEARSSFALGAETGTVEAAIPWTELFPEAPFAINPDSLGPEGPMFVLPATAAAQGLRLAAALVHREDGLGAADVAPDPSAALSLDATLSVNIDRAARVDWSTAGPPHFVRFGFALQEQSAPRFVPDAPATAPPAGAFEVDLVTFRDGDPSQAPTRLVVPDRDLAVAFALRPRGTVPAVLYVTSVISTLQGERIVELLQDEPVTCSGSGVDCSTVPSRWRWDGRDAAGHPVRGGYYVLRLTAGTSPGTQTVRAQRTLAVVH